MQKKIALIYSSKDSVAQLLRLQIVRNEGAKLQAALPFNTDLAPLFDKLETVFVAINDQGALKAAVKLAVKHKNVYTYNPHHLHIFQPSLHSPPSAQYLVLYINQQLTDLALIDSSAKYQDWASVAQAQKILVRTLDISLLQAYRKLYKYLQLQKKDAKQSRVESVHKISKTNLQGIMAASLKQKELQRLSRFQVFAFSDIMRDLFDRLFVRDRLKLRKLDYRIPLDERERQKYATEFETRCLSQIYYHLNMRTEKLPLYLIGSLQNSSLLREIVFEKNLCTFQQDLTLPHVSLHTLVAQLYEKRPELFSQVSTNIAGYSEIKHLAYGVYE